MNAVCGHVTAELVELTLEVWEGVCGVSEGVRMFITGLRCPRHTPAAMAGRPEVVVDPELTLDALKRKAGRATYVPPPNDSSLLNDRAIASGRRRSSSAAYRQAQKAEHSRRMAEKARRSARGDH